MTLNEFKQSNPSLDEKLVDKYLSFLPDTVIKKDLDICYSKDTKEIKLDLYLDNTEEFATLNFHSDNFNEDVIVGVLTGHEFLISHIDIHKLSNYLYNKDFRNEYLNSKDIVDVGTVSDYGAKLFKEKV